MQKNLMMKIDGKEFFVFKAVYCWDRNWIKLAIGEIFIFYSKNIVSDKSLVIIALNCWNFKIKINLLFKKSSIQVIEVKILYFSINIIIIDVVEIWYKNDDRERRIVTNFIITYYLPKEWGKLKEWKSVIFLAKRKIYIFIKL